MYNVDARDGWYGNILELSGKSSWDDLDFADFAHQFYCDKIGKKDCFDNMLKPRCRANGKPRSCGKFSTRAQICAKFMLPNLFCFYIINYK